jgi:hypothetical protein
LAALARMIEHLIKITSAEAESKGAKESLPVERIF